ncbi:hypothetical protein MRB53_026350 [Persea americana]|uniref:Uncharacterized protein n=1 Tax=Persea americana TaxID=3435 RepID=A0ACC2LJ08_PERAE|nr:hypothetical protein MRB53_026350 [Persea americana]
MVTGEGTTQQEKPGVQPVPDEGRWSLLWPSGDGQCEGLFDHPLQCFGCGIGWLFFILGFVFPPLWYYAAFLYFRNYYLRDPRERAGLAASAIAALICTVIVLVSLLAALL